MYAQKTFIRTPLGKGAEVRRLIAQKYLPAVRQHPGFFAAYLLEQTDDPDRCELLQLWDRQSSLENFHKTGFLEASLQGIAVDVPGCMVQSQGYMIHHIVMAEADATVNA
ncbi:MAG: antibiotic biosynthesis monooxygenase [Anaerolineae bacterium]|nr:antibiotic biosynthesis monooxygenase [Anaerolineae bacterium]